MIPEGSEALLRVESNLSPSWFFGVDGGGSRVRVRVIDAGGRHLSSAEGGSANVYLAPEAALKTISVALRQAIESAGLDDSALRWASLGLGLAGVSSPVVGTRVAACFAPLFGRVVARHDGSIACLGAHAGQDGGLVIAGTGSAALLRLRGRATSIGGRGFLLGDDGSGAVMGRDIWRRALRAHDGLDAATPLLQALMAEFNHDPVAVIAWGRTATSADFAATMPRIFAAAHDGDPAALSVIHSGAAAVAELIEVLAARGASRISLTGGLADSIRLFLPSATRARLAPPLYDALDGALLLAGAPVSIIDGMREQPPTVIDTFKARP